MVDMSLVLIVTEVQIPPHYPLIRVVIQNPTYSHSLVWPIRLLVSTHYCLIIVGLFVQVTVHVFPCGRAYFFTQWVVELAMWLTLAKGKLVDLTE